MLAKSATPAEILAQETPQQQMENHPVIRTLYDHAGVRCQLDCSPQKPFKLLALIKAFLFRISIEKDLIAVTAEMQFVRNALIPVICDHIVAQQNCLV